MEYKGNENANTFDKEGIEQEREVIMVYQEERIVINAIIDSEQSLSCKNSQG